MIRHISSIAEVVEDIDTAVGFYRDVLGFDVEYDPGSGYAIVKVPGILHFGIWDHTEAAKLTFGNADSAKRIPFGFSVGFEVDDVAEASKAMINKGWSIVQPKKEEPWGQLTSRFYSASGALCEFSEMPGARRLIRTMEAGGENGG